MFRPQIHILLTTNRIEGACVANGRIVRTFRLELEEHLIERAWKDGFETLDHALGQVVRGLAAPAGSIAALSYVAPTTTIEVLGVQAAARDARDAAMLSLSEMVSEPVDRLPTTVLLLSAGKRESFVLACAEKNETSESLRAWMLRGGLRPVAMRPISALAVREACSRSPHTSGKDGCSVFIGHRTIIIEVRAAGEVKLVRQVELGVEQLQSVYLSALHRSSRFVGERAESPSHTTEEEYVDSAFASEADTSDEHASGGMLRARATLALFTHGIPSPQTVVDELTQTRGVVVLPLLQPVLQRISIEIKQTLRFGTTEFDPARGVVQLLGPGGVIPGLATYLGEHLDMSINPATEPVDIVAVGGAGSELFQAIRCGVGDLNLMPRSAVQASMQRNLRRATVAGAVLALTIMATEAASKVAAIARVSDSIATLEPEVRKSQSKVALRQTASDMAARLLTAELAVSVATSDKPDWSASLVLLEAASSPSVRLTDLVGGYQGRRPTLTIKGFAMLGADGADPLRGYMAQLVASPLIENVSLGTTRTTEIDGHAARSFTMALQLRAASELASIVEGE